MYAVDVNYLSVTIASLVNMLIGYLWYSPYIFGKKWAQLSGISRRNKSMFGRILSRYILIYFLISFFTAYILANFSDYLGIMTIGEGAQLGLWIWFGFVATTVLYDYIYPKKSASWTLYFIDTGYILAGLMVMAMILAVWR